MKGKNSWHKKMYKYDFATQTIGSKIFNDLALKEVEFLLKKLNLSKGSNILDVPCGTGRHAFVLAKYGHQVTGIDISKDCLTLAKKYCSNKVKLKMGSMEKLENYKGQFDLVLNLFTSFGYFATDQENKMVLKQMVNCLKPNGRVMINTINRDWLMTVFKSTTVNIVDDQIHLYHRVYDHKSKYNQEQTYLIDIKTKKIVNKRYHRIRLYNKDEMVALMKEVGLKKIKVYGSFEDDPFSKTKSPRPIYVGTR